MCQIMTGIIEFERNLSIAELFVPKNFIDFQLYSDLGNGPKHEAEIEQSAQKEKSCGPQQCTAGWLLPYVGQALLQN